MRYALTTLLLLLSCGHARADLELADGTVLPDSPMWIVTYIEVAYDSDLIAMRMLNQHVENSRAEEGNLYFQAVQRIGRPSHFVIMEAWATPEARAKHAAAEHTLKFRNDLHRFLYSPYDERVHVGLEVADALAIPEGDANSIYAITHLDYSPPEQFAPCNRRPDPSGPCGNELVINLAKNSREHMGNLRFDVLTQSNRPNHMKVVAIWENQRAFHQHQLNRETRDFRDAIAGLEEGSGVHPDPQFTMSRLIGSLWDERLYRQF